jgi:hypothetical protein
VAGAGLTEGLPRSGGTASAAGGSATTDLGDRRDQGGVSAGGPGSSGAAKGSPSEPNNRVGPGFAPGQTELLGEADGFLPPGATVFDGQYPGVGNLDAILLAALREAAKAAAADAVPFNVSSGWRTAAYQEHLLEQAVGEYGSAEEAARWVASPAKSLHVAGAAVDLENAAAEWLAKNGARYGLCRVYQNEPWHFELRSTAPSQGCPALYADPTEDPRLR